MIQTYHAHIYFTLGQMVLAAQVRENILNQLPQLDYRGQLIPMPIGPHPLPMFELHVPASQINYAMATIDSLREGLSVLTDELDAHSSSARWLGTKLTLNLNVLK